MWAVTARRVAHTVPTRSATASPLYRCLSSANTSGWRELHQPSAEDSMRLIEFAVSEGKLKPGRRVLQAYGLLQRLAEEEELMLIEIAEPQSSAPGGMPMPAELDGVHASAEPRK